IMVKKVANKQNSLLQPTPGPAPWIVFPFGKGRKSQTFTNILDPLRRSCQELPRDSGKKMFVINAWIVGLREASNISWNNDLSTLHGSGEEIYYVVIHHLGTNNLKAIGHVEIFKMDFVKEVWVKVESLGGRNFILSDKGCMSFSATKSGTEGNIIYFTLYEDNGCLYAFGVEDGSLSVYLPCPKLKTPFFSPFWLMLSDSNRYAMHLTLTLS
ncbi:hypothetical protein IFM89_027799, partial [Coptis chinensis]